MIVAVHRIRWHRIGATNRFFRKEPTITLDNVQSTATSHTAGVRDGASHRDDGRLDVELSSPVSPSPGSHPEANHAPTAKRVLPRMRMIMFPVSSAPTRRS